MRPTRRQHAAKSGPSDWPELLAVRDLRNAERTTDVVGLFYGLGVGATTRMGRGLRAQRVPADRLDRQRVPRSQRSGTSRADPTAARDREAARFVGHPPRAASGWAGLRAGETGSAQRDSGPVGVRTDRFRLAGTRFRQQ